MSLSFCILGSGSGGNSTLLALSDSAGTVARSSRPCENEHGGNAGATDPDPGPSIRYVLIDAGLSPQQTLKRLAPLGVTLADVSDIVLTHLDTDHFHPGWIKGAEKYDVQLHMHHRHRTRAARQTLNFKRITLFEEEFELDIEPRASATRLSAPVARFNCIHFAHDDLGTVGFVVEHDSLRLGFATDVGRVPDSLFDCFCNLHALAIESNYDRDMQLSSRRPIYLKRRIMDGRGHLCNEQSIDAAMRIAHRSRLSHVALLHLSRQCNCPRLVQSLYAKKAPHLLPILTVSNQFEPTPMLHVAVGEKCDLAPPPRPAQQLVMF